MAPRERQSHQRLRIKLLTARQSACLGIPVAKSLVMGQRPSTARFRVTAQPIVAATGYQLSTQSFE